MAGQQQIGVEVIAVGIAAFSRAMRTAQDDLERTTNSINRISGVTHSFGKSLTELGGNMQRIGRAMLIDVTAPLGILTGTLINAGIQFQDSFAGISKTVDGVAVGFDEIKAAAQKNLGITITTMDEARVAATEMGMAFGDLTPIGQEIRNQFRQMALEVPIATTELNNLGEIVGQLGVESQDIAGVTKLVAELGVATDIAAEDAAFGLIRMANIMDSVGTSVGSMEEFIRRAGSALVDLGNNSVATEGEILNFALRLSAAGDMAKLSEQEVLAWATTLADLGARAESGGTAVSRALNEMLIAVKSGSKSLPIFAGIVGMTGQQFQKAFEEDASGALATFTKALGDGLNAGTITKKMLTDMGLGGIRAADIMLRLSDAQGIFNKNLDHSNTAWDQAIALEEEAEKRFGTFKSQLQLLKNTFTDLGISIFDLVEGDLKVLVGHIKDAINWFKDLDDGLKKNIVIFAAIAATIGPILIIFGGLISMLGAVATGITALGAAALPVIGILGSLLAVAGLAAGASIASQPQKAASTPEAASASVQEAAGRGAIQPIKTPLQIFLDKTQFKETMDSLKANINGILQSIDTLKIPDMLKDSGILDSADKFGEFLKTSGTEAFATALDNIKRAADSFTITFREIIENQGPNLEILFADIKALIDDLQPAFQALADAFSELFGGTDAESFGDGLAKLAGISLEVLIAGLDGLVLVINVLVRLITILAPVVGDLIWWFLNLQSVTLELGNVIREGLLDAWQQALLKLSEFGLKVIGKFEELKAGVGQKLREFVNSVKAFFVGLYEDLIGHSIITDMLDDILTAFVESKDNLLLIIGELVSGITSAFSGIGTQIGTAIGGLLGGASGGGGAAQGGAATTAGEEAPAEGGGAAGMFNVQQIAALQQAIIGLQETWAGFGVVASNVLMTLNKTMVTLGTFTKTLFTSMAISFTAAFIVPVTTEIALFGSIFTAQTTLVDAQWRQVCLNMVRSWLDFVANSLKLLGEFVASAGGEFINLQNNGQGAANELGLMFSDLFGPGGSGEKNIINFITQIGSIGGAFAKLKGAVAGFVHTMEALLLSICDTAADVMGCLTASPELKIQHPFERFEDYMKSTSFGKLAEKSLSMPMLENITTVIPNLQGNVTNIDRSISSSITGLPLDTAENVADTMLRTIRMSEGLQGV